MGQKDREKKSGAKGGEALRIGVIGCGRWGANYIRVLNELVSSTVEAVCDSDPSCLEKIKERFPSIRTTVDIDDVVGSNSIDAVVVATPASTHYEVVTRALSTGKHVLVEKPIALTIDDSREMIELSMTTDRVLMVGHTFLFNAGVRKLRECVNDSSFGNVYYLYATRTNMGPIRKDVNALWDLAAHDLSIFNYLLDSSPLWVSATGSRLFKNGREDVGFMTLGYPDNVIANIHVSWADPYKVREVVVVGSRKRVIFDDLEGLERIKVFHKGVVEDEEADSFGEFRLLLRDGDIFSPRVDNAEPLKEQCLHFIDCVREKRRPISDGAAGLNVVTALVAADESLRQQGAPVEITGAPPSRGGTRGVMKDEKQGLLLR